MVVQFFRRAQEVERESEFWGWPSMGFWYLISRASATYYSPTGITGNSLCSRNVFDVQNAPFALKVLNVNFIFGRWYLFYAQSGREHSDACSTDAYRVQDPAKSTLEGFQNQMMVIPEGLCSKESFFFLMLWKQLFQNVGNKKRWILTYTMIVFGPILIIYNPTLLHSVLLLPM